MAASRAAESLAAVRALARRAGSLFDQAFWGTTRHRLIGEAAERLLSATARKVVRQLLAPLGEGTGLADVAAWADDLKHGPIPDDPETAVFLDDPRNENHGAWHFVDLPLGAQGYDRQRYAYFTRPDDVVQILSEAVRVLTGDSDRFSRINALRLVVHLTGDVHQPLHVACGYIDPTTSPPTIVRDPAHAAAKHLRSDRGGNDIILPLGPKQSNLQS
jgi:hypothetical protein